MLINDYPVTLMKYKVYPVLGGGKVTAILFCDNCIKKIADVINPKFAYNFDRLVDYGSCSVCGIHTVKKHLYIKSMSKGKGK